jgi:sarcosine oxidase delta subunit
MPNPTHPDAHPDAAALAAEVLLPCPFCGSKNVSLSQGAHADGKPWPYIECAECAACAEPAFWNRRAALSQRPESTSSRDAARYRWLLDNARNSSDGDDGVCLVVPIYSEDWDEKCGEAIDKAMQADGARAQLGGKVENS